MRNSELQPWPRALPYRIHVDDGAKEIVGQPGGGGVLVDLLADAVSGAILIQPDLELCFHAVQEVGQLWVGYVHRETFSEEDGTSRTFSEEDGTSRKSVGHIL